MFVVNVWISCHQHGSLLWQHMNAEQKNLVTSIIIHRQQRIKQDTEQLQNFQSVKSTSLHPTFLKCILMLSSHILPFFKWSLTCISWFYQCVLHMHKFLHLTPITILRNINSQNPLLCNFLYSQLFFFSLRSLEFYIQIHIVFVHPSMCKSIFHN